MPNFSVYFTDAEVLAIAKLTGCIKRGAGVQQIVRKRLESENLVARAQGTSDAVLDMLGVRREASQNNEKLL